jgi:hypothetical protein
VDTDNAFGSRVGPASGPRAAFRADSAMLRAAPGRRACFRSLSFMLFISLMI